MSAPLQTAAAPGAQVGRPRDFSRDEAVFRAVRELLVEEGYQALSVNKVTLRCGVHVRTIARRWNTKAEMVAAAVLGGSAPLNYGSDLPSGRLGKDLRELIERTLRYLSLPAIQVAMPALMSEVSVNAKVREQIERREDEWTATIRSVLECAVESGDAPERVLGCEHVLGRAMSGAVYSLQFSPMRDRDEHLADELANFFLGAVLAHGG